MARNVRLINRGMRELLNSDDIGDMLERRMQPALSAARADTHDDTGAYEAGLHLERDHTDRVVVRLVSGNWKGHILEARYGILARSLDAAGGA